MAGSETGGSTGALYSLSEHQKRWVVFGLALNEVLVKGIRRHVGKQVKKEYENVKTQKGIDSQSKSGRLKKWSFDLKYKNINGNAELPEGHDLDYRVTSHVDFAKLYLEWYMAKFNAFDEHCDASAVLNLLGRVRGFCDSVKQAASDVREARNSWAHPAFGDWDSAKFNKCFDDMVQLVKVLGLSRGEHVVNELNDWKEKGTLLCLSPPDPELLQFVKQHVNTLEENVDKMAFETKQERQAVKKSLQDFSTRIEKLEEGFSSLEYRVTKLEEGETSSMHLETANTGTSPEPETTAGGVETRTLKRKNFTGHSSRVPPKRKKGIQTETAQLAESKPLEDLVNDPSNFLDEICELLDILPEGRGNYEHVAKHYGYKVATVKARFKTSPDGPSKALILSIIAGDPDVTVESFAEVVVEHASRGDVARLLREFDLK